MGLGLGLGLRLGASTALSSILSIGTGELYFADNVSTYGWYVATTPNAIYDSVGNKTWVAYEGWDGSNRAVYVTVFDHATSTWSARVKAGVSSLHDDDHGVPSMVMDGSGYVHIFYGSHNQDFLWVKTTSVRNPSAWTTMSNSPSGGQLSYPHPNLYGSQIFVFARSYVGGTAPNDKYTGVLYKNTTSAWGSKITFFDLGSNTRTYFGNFVTDSSGKFHFLITNADLTDTYRRDIFYLIYDPVTGSISNHDGSHVVAEASFPIGLSDANTYFRIYEHDTSGATAAEKYSGNIPSLCLDSNGKPHVVFFNGLTTGIGYTGGGFEDIDIMYMNKVGASWSTPEIIGNCSQKYDGSSIVALDSGKVQVLMTSDAVSDNSQRGGNMLKRTRAADGTWSATETVKEQALPYALDAPNVVHNGHSDLRFVFLETAPDYSVDSIPVSDDDKAGYQRVFAYGDRGFVRNTANITITPSVSSFSDAATIGSTLAVLTASHPRATLSIVSDPDNKFDLSGSNLISTDTFNYATATSHSVTIRASLRDKTYDTTLVFDVTDSTVGFSPTDLSGNVLWLTSTDAATITQSAGAVSQWDDKSGSGYNVTQPTGASQPITGTDTINGLNALRFTSKSMIVPSGLYGVTNGDHTIFALIDLVSSPTTPERLPWSASNTSGGRGQIFFDWASTDSASYRFGASPTPVNISSAGLTAGAKAIMAKLGGTSINVRLDGKSATGTGSPFTSTSMSIGSGGAGALLIGEVIVYNRALSNSEINQVMNYLKDKWGSSWTDI